MDIVLEIFDTFAFDRIYSSVLPRDASLYTIFDPVSTLVAKGSGNASFGGSSFTSGSAPPSTWQFSPASPYFSVQPSEYAWMSRWDRDNLYRQTISLYFLAWIFGVVIYLTCATFSYVFVFDKTTFQHPKYLKNQMKLEIQQTLRSIPIMAIFTIPAFIAEVRGHSYMYDDVYNPGFDSPLLKALGGWYTWLQFPIFILFTDFLIYWIHRGLHHPILYKRLHKPHHKWIMPTPYASHAFHPLDGYAQSVPYHLFPFVMPLNKFAFIALFTFIQIWTIMIHDGEYVANSPVINGAACHTMHHLYFNYNYGQFTTLWDRLGGSYRKPNDELFQKETKWSSAEWTRQTKEMEKMVVEVEGEDDRTYTAEEGESVKKMQ